LELLKKLRLQNRYAPRNETRCVFQPLRVIRRIEQQSQIFPWDFFNSPYYTFFDELWFIMIVLKEDSGWAELLRSFGTQTSAVINYGGPGIMRQWEIIANDD